MTKSVVGTLAVTLLVGACSDEAMPTGPTQPSSTTATATPGTSGGSGTPAACTLPDRPTGLRVTSAVGTVVELTWDPVPGATGYTLLVGSTPGGSNILNANTSQNSFRFTARDGRQYARVQAHNTCGTGPSTGSIEFITTRP